jgi:hypothetical protein
MRYVIVGAGLWAALILPVGGADKANKKKANYQATQADYDALLQAQIAVGKVSDLASTDRTFTLQFPYQYLVAAGKAGGKGNSQVNSLLRQQKDILATRDPIKRMQRLEQLILKAKRLTAKGGRQPFKIKSSRKDFDLRAIEEVKVRVLKPPVEYDDKGNIKKHTAKELKELKGKDPKLPGYTADWDQLVDGQTVKVYLKPRKKKPATEKDKGAARDKDTEKKDKDKDADELEDDYRPLVKMVVILAEPDSNNNQPRKKGQDR